MYKRALTVLLTAHLLFLAGFLCLGQMEEIQRNLQIKVPVAADSESRMIGIASRTSSGQRVVDCNELQRNSRYHLDMAELEVLLKIVEAEAGCEDEEGKLLVANVISVSYTHLAVKVENFHAVIDPEKCVGCGACMEKCPKKCIVKA